MDLMDQTSVHSTKGPDVMSVSTTNPETASLLAATVSRAPNMSEPAVDSHALPPKPDMAVSINGKQTEVIGSSKVIAEGYDEKDADPILAFTADAEYLSLGLPTSFGKQESIRPKAGTGSRSAANTADGPNDTSNQPVRSFTFLYIPIVSSCLLLMAVVCP